MNITFELREKVVRLAGAYDAAPANARVAAWREVEGVISRLLNSRCKQQRGGSR